MPFALGSVVSTQRTLRAQRGMGGNRETGNRPLDHAQAALRFSKGENRKKGAKGRGPEMPVAGNPQNYSNSDAQVTTL